MLLVFFQNRVDGSVLRIGVQGNLVEREAMNGRLVEEVDALLMAEPHLLPLLVASSN